jgi:pyridoxamine 5'-phosphate oxidase
MVNFVSYESEPLKLFKSYFDLANLNNQKSIDAMCITSIDLRENKPYSRFVNLKYIQDDQLIFFTNYKSKKASQFQKCNNVCCIFFWSSIDMQIRINGTVEKSCEDFSDFHFSQRSRKKNALAISSNQSSKVSSYNEVLIKYNKVLSSCNSLNRPSYWGGYSISPTCFEFWKGDPSRLNQRTEYEKEENRWKKTILEP